MMAKFFTFAPDLRPDSRELALDRRESHHLFHVLRWQPGDELYAFNGRGLVAAIQPMHPGRDGTICQVQGVCQRPMPTPKLILLQPLIRTESFDAILRQASELAVDEIWPILTDRSTKVSSIETVMRRVDRWRRITIEACKQSKNARLPRIPAPAPLIEAIDGLEEGSMGLLASLERGALSMAETGQVITSQRAKTIYLLVGPEGDFSSEEYALLAGRHWTPVSLGSTILTSETAALSMILLASIFGRQRDGQPWPDSATE